MTEVSLSLFLSNRLIEPLFEFGIMNADAITMTVTDAIAERKKTFTWKKDFISFKKAIVIFIILFGKVHTAFFNLL